MSTKEQQEWEARVEAENIHAGRTVRAMRVITDQRNYVIHKWWEPAEVIEVRGRDAVVQFQDGTRSSSGLGLEVPSVGAGPLELAPEEREELAKAVRSELEYITDALDSSEGFEPDHIRELEERRTVLERLAGKV